MNGIKGYISIRGGGPTVVACRSGGSISIASRGGSLASPSSGVHGRFRKMRKSRPTCAFRNSTAIPAGQAPDGSLQHWNWKHPQKGGECDGLR